MPAAFPSVVLFDLQPEIRPVQASSSRRSVTRSGARCCQSISIQCNGRVKSPEQDLRRLPRLSPERSVDLTEGTAETIEKHLHVRGRAAR